MQTFLQSQLNTLSKRLHKFQDLNKNESYVSVKLKTFMEKSNG